MTSNDQNKKLILLLKRNQENLKSYLLQDESLESLKDENMDACLQSNYIHIIMGCQSVKILRWLYKVGGEFYRVLLKALEDVKEFILWNGLLLNVVFACIKQNVFWIWKKFLEVVDISEETTEFKVELKGVKKLNTEVMEIFFSLF